MLDEVAGVAWFTRSMWKSSIVQGDEHTDEVTDEPTGTAPSESAAE